MPRAFSHNSVRRTVLSFLAVAVLAPGGQTAFADSNIYRQTLPATAWIVSKTSQGIAVGSGVLVDREKRLVVTNFHVVDGALQVAVFFPQQSDGRPITEKGYYVNNADRIRLWGRVIASDPRRDLALIELSSVPDGAPAIDLAEESAHPGDIVHSIGNPAFSRALWVYSTGPVRAVYRMRFRTQIAEHDMTVVETAAPINPGDSGGPVVDREGRLVALVQSYNTQARLMSYCVDVSEIRAFLAEDRQRKPGNISQILEQVGPDFARPNDLSNAPVQPARETSPSPGDPAAAGGGRKKPGRFGGF